MSPTPALNASYYFNSEFFTMKEIFFFLFWAHSHWVLRGMCGRARTPPSMMETSNCYEPWFLVENGQTGYEEEGARSTCRTAKN